MEERRLHLEAGFPSMFAFCTRELGMSENEAFRRLMANPSRELSVVVERAVDLLVAELEKRRLARTKFPRQKLPREEQPAEEPISRSRRRTTSGRIPSSARREVFERDGLRCTYVSPEGHRCDARAFLELDHVEPRALGGTDDARNLRVRCRAHNQLAAERVFGRETVEGHRHFVRQKRRHESRADAPSTMDRVRSALKSMGFLDSQARRAIAEVERSHAGAQSLAVELALREALLAATANRA